MSTKTTPIVETKLWRRSKVEEFTTLSKASIDRRCRSGAFPQPIRLSKRRLVWRASEVIQWVEGLAENSVAPADIDTGAA